MKKLVTTLALVVGLAACQPSPAFAPDTPVCPTDGTVYVVGSCDLDPSVMPWTSAPLPVATHWGPAAPMVPVPPIVVGDLAKWCSGNFECPADYPDPGDGQPLTGCATTDYHSCPDYRP